MKNRGTSPILTNFVGVHPRNIHTKFEANPFGSREEVKKTKKVHAHDDDDNDDDENSLIARLTLTPWVWLKMAQTASLHCTHALW